METNVPGVYAIGDCVTGKARGTPYKVGKFPLAANGKTLILNGGEGLAKIIADARFGEILGVHIIGPGATDLIAEGALAIGEEMALNEIINTIHSLPAVPVRLPANGSISSAYCRFGALFSAAARNRTFAASSLVLPLLFM